MIKFLKKLSYTKIQYFAECSSDLDSVYAEIMSKPDPKPIHVFFSLLSLKLAYKISRNYILDCEIFKKTNIDIIAFEIAIFNLKFYAANLDKINRKITNNEDIDIDICIIVDQVLNSLTASLNYILDIYSENYGHDNVKQRIHKAKLYDRSNEEIQSLFAYRLSACAGISRFEEEPSLRVSEIDMN
jgi:hypothetical protein